LTLLKNFHLKHLLYLIKITYNTIKFGYTNNIKRRLKEHKDQIGEDITLEFCIETMYNIELEKTLKIKLNNEVGFK
jgi:predicted GIY-YIG superfamily endonuclease